MKILKIGLLIALILSTYPASLCKAQHAIVSYQKARQNLAAQQREKERVINELVDASNSRKHDFCKIDDDCPRLRCGAECGMVCIRNQCVKVKCQDHGKVVGHKCICNKGYTGTYCEKKIQQ